MIVGLDEQFPAERGQLRAQPGPDIRKGVLVQIEGSIISFYQGAEENAGEKAKGRGRHGER